MRDVNYWRMLCEQRDAVIASLKEELSDSQETAERLQGRITHLVTNNEELEREVKALRMYITEVIEGGTAVS